MLELRNVSLQTEDGQEILKNVSVTIPTGSFTAITGPNGGGKSTLAKVICGIMTPTKGQILLNGEDITNLSITQRAQKGISFAFQQPVRFKGIRVLDLLRLAAGRALTVPEACNYLGQVGLQAHSYVHREMNASLSGGESKRIEIAMSLVRGTALSIFDEPEAGIDLWSFQNLIEVFRSLRARGENTILIISHQERILDIADQLVVMADGEVTAAGPGSAILPELLANEGACAYCMGGCPPDAGCEGCDA